MQIFKSILTAGALICLSACGGAGEGGNGSDQPDRTQDNSTPTISVSKVQVVEGSNNHTVEVTFVRQGDLGKPSKINYELVGVSATAGQDFVGGTGSLTFPSNVGTVTLPIEVIGDLAYEADELLQVSLGAVENVTLKVSSVDVILRNDDAYPTLGFSIDKQFVAENAGRAELILTLSNPTYSQVSTTVVMAGTAIMGQDYALIDSPDIRFNPLETVLKVGISILQDRIPEGGETIIARLGALENATKADVSSSTFIISGQVVLNDTGYTTYTDGSIFNLAGSPADYPGQDGLFGLDRSENSALDGMHALSFTKLDQDGNTLSEGSTNYACVRDNRTGVVYEAKNSRNQIRIYQNDRGVEVREVDSSSNYRSSSFEYFWYNPSKVQSGGSAGHQDELIDTKKGIGATCAYPPENSRPHKLYCNTESFISEVNWRGLCGHKNWRLPTIEELRSVALYDSEIGDENGRLDPLFFRFGYPDGVAGQDQVEYFSSTPSAANSASAWCFNPYFGTARLCHKGTVHFVRLVRSGE